MNQKSNKGITLIALVVTIIVLLILAGVTLNIVLGDDGIIAKAQSTKKIQKKAEEKDIIALAIAEAETSNYMEVMTEEEVEIKLGDIFDNDTTTAKPSYNDSVRDIKEFTASNGITKQYLPIPKGMAYAFGTIDEGVVVVDGYGNEYVWVPVDTFSDFAVLQADGENYRGQLWATSIGNNFGTKNETYNLNSGLREPALLGGHYDGNLPNIKAILEEKYITDNGEYTRDALLEQFQEEYNAMVGSVKTYGGFYVGRYETSWTGSRVASIGNVVSMTSATLLEPTWATSDDSNVNKATWYGLYAKQKELHANSECIVSGMIYGAQWDAIMNWMSDIENPNVEGAYYIKNSTGMGWYDDNYTEGNPTHITGLELNGGMNKVNNIYDLAGNYYEWTQEATGDSIRVDRGGTYYKSGSDRPASYRNNYDSPLAAANVVSSRIQLYIK